MQQKIRISTDIQELLCCPKCHAKLKLDREMYECINLECAAQYPIVDGIPVLINENMSIFTINDYISHRKTTIGNVSKNIFVKTIDSLLPPISKNIKGKINYRRFVDILLGQSRYSRVLVVGGSSLGQGMEPLVNNPAINLVESDVAFGPRTMLICDAHNIPFEDRSFDGVIVQAVLEHVIDPYRCCEEIHRVLREEGIVYSETPFIQQVHGGRYDFTRFTHLGHRRLFRRFTEIDSGAVCGPGMALAWSYQYFLLSFATSRFLRAVVRVFSQLTSFYLIYFDQYLINKPGTLDAASAYYFIGKKADQVLSDHDLITQYKGLGT